MQCKELDILQVCYLLWSYWGRFPSVHNVWSLHLPRGNISAWSQHLVFSWNSLSPFPSQLNGRAQIQESFTSARPAVSSHCCLTTEHTSHAVVQSLTQFTLKQMWGSEEIVKSHLLLANSSINFSQKCSGNSTLVSEIFPGYFLLWFIFGAVVKLYLETSTVWSASCSYTHAKNTLILPFV